MLATYPKKRIEIVVEVPALHRLLDRLDRAKVSGYTVIPALEGRGREGSWSREGLAGEAGRMVVVVCITDSSKVDAVLEGAYAVVSRQIGIISITDVQVIRADHF
jgi:hypothetical protein